MAAATTTRPERFIHSPYRLGPDRPDAEARILSGAALADQDEPAATNCPHSICGVPCLVELDQRPPGHCRRLRQAEELEQSRRYIGQPSVFEVSDCSRRVHDDERHRVQGMRGM